jgi:alpha-ribazole phosphatase
MEATQAIPVFLALQPDEAATQQIWQYKRRVRELVGDQLYLDHPPHLTFFLAAFSDLDAVVDSTRRVACDLKAPAVFVNGWHTFFGDPLTGFNTLVLDLTETDRERLRQIQMRLVELLGPHRDGDASLARINGHWPHLSGVEKAAAKAYGFPYVGAGWHPHFTVASIEPRVWPTVANELLREAPSGSFTCPRIQVYELIGNEPSLVESFELKRTAPPARALAPPALKDELIAAMWRVVDRHDWILSATLTGSFLIDPTLAAISDIDLVVIVEELNGPRFDSLQQEFSQALTPPLAERGLKLRINPTLGPRKLNDDRTAVLHLMVYSRDGHHQHAIKSPFTCLDWQRSTVRRKRSMAEVYPVFGLQPHHFLCARRGLRDYLHDFERGVVSYREIQCTAESCTEVRREESMTTRGRYEYAYHVMRFLMQNLLKLVRRSNRVSDGTALVDQFSAVFPRGVAGYADLFQELQWRKARRDFSTPIPRLGQRLCKFVSDFESQFRSVFFETATRHIFFRHAPTQFNGGVGEERRFQGRSDHDIEPVTLEQLTELLAALNDVSIARVFTSPLRRCRQTLELLGQHAPLPAMVADPRLIEIDYGRCEGLSVADARRQHPALFDEWQARRDPRFPGGENWVDVYGRIKDFLRGGAVSGDPRTAASANALVCTHNVVLRCLVGEALGVPRADWYRIEVPHLAPITVVQTRDYGWFVDLEESVEQRLFASFLHPFQEPR